MSESGPELAVPWNLVEVMNAATPVIPQPAIVLQSTANVRHPETGEVKIVDI